MKIVSGKTGTPHVTSEQFRQIIEGTVGQGSYILTSGENLEPELASNNMLKIRGGMMSHHGNVSFVDLNTYDEVTLTNGSQGVKRIDLVVNRYTRNDETGLEKNEWVVIIGTPDATNPKVPEYIAGNLQNGDLTDDCPVFEVHYDGINVTEVKKLLPVMSNLDLLNGNFEKLVDGNKYSVSAEIDTGEVWHDGRKIYKRTFVTTESIVFKTPITIPITGVAMSEFWIDTQNSFISTASVCYPLPMVGYGGDPDEHIYVWLNSSGIRIGSTKGGWGTGWKKTVTIRYTKL